MDPVARQYEAYPYPARDPAEEAKRLITGSPSDPPEIDHMLFGGRRDWSKPFKALVAGGGTGDGLIMLAQKLADIRCPAEIHYLDMSAASRKLAEARAAARGLTGIQFETGDLLTAPDRGRFDYIDCTGVLHHLPEPQAGFDALAAALAPGGGIGGMVYAPYGRTGVYPMQAALRALTDGETPEAQVAAAKDVLAALPEGAWINRNPYLADHKISDAGLYDLLLHSRDRPYDVKALVTTLGRAGLTLTSFVEPARYDPRQILPKPLHSRLDGMEPVAQMALAERLAGDLKAHVFYAAHEARAPAKMTPNARPRLNDLPAAALARQIDKRGALKIEGRIHPLSKKAAPLVALADGSRRLGEIAQARGLDWFAFAALWGPVDKALTGWNLLRYSEGAK